MPCRARRARGVVTLDARGRRERRVDRLAEATVPSLVQPDTSGQDVAIDIGPQRVDEDQFRVRGLPEQEVRDPLLPGRAHEQVDRRHLRVVEPGGQGIGIDGP